MRSSKETYKQVAERCSSYDKKEGKDSFSNSVSDTGKSCLNCRHFANDEHCRLDLYDPIVNNMCNCGK